MTKTTDELLPLYSVGLGADGRSAAPGLWRCRRFTLQELLDLQAARVGCLVVIGHLAELRSLTFRHPHLAGLVEAMRVNSDPAGPMLRLAGEINGPRPAGLSFIYVSRAASLACLPMTWRLHELAILSPVATTPPPAAAMVPVPAGAIRAPGCGVLDVDCTRKPAPDLPKPAVEPAPVPVEEKPRRRRRVAASRSRRPY